MFLLLVFILFFFFFFFFFNATATTEIYTLSLHDALPISRRAERPRRALAVGARVEDLHAGAVLGLSRARREGCAQRDRKSTRLNSSHMSISYAVFCLKKKKKKQKII